jgi:hypothetical protein
MGPTGYQSVTLRDLLDSRNSAKIKQFYMYDADGNPTNIFFAQAEAAGGDPCLEQVLEYTVVSGQSVVEKQAWRTAVWSGMPWDISS